MITVRNINSKDIDDLYYWRIDQDVQDSSIDEMEPTREAHTFWFNTCNIDANYIVEVNENKIGTFSFREEQPHNKLIWAFHLNPEYKGRRYKGLQYSKILCKEALKIGFKKLNANKIVGEVLSNNIKSVKLHLSLGFKEEGLLKKEIYKNGNYVDLYRFALLKEEYSEY